MFVKNQCVFPVPAKPTRHCLREPAISGAGASALRSMDLPGFLMQPTMFLVWTSLVKTLFILFGAVLPLVSLSVFAERKVSAFIQDRIGPNRVGLPTSILGFKKDLRLAGLGQMIADPIKLLLKENFIPASVNKFYYYIAPKLTMIPPLLVLAVVPFGSTFLGVPMVIANVNIGVLYVFAITSLSVYGIVLAGWASNSKYPFLGGIRSSSQMISYELALGLSVVPIFLVCGTLNLSDIVQWQIHHGWLILPFSFTEGFSLHRLAIWVTMLISFIVFLVSMFAETNRTPFDLPEAEQELVGGYHTEYSSMGFALFFLGEYAAMIAGSGVIVTLFLGGWSLPFVPDGTSHWLPFGLATHVPEWLPGVFWALVNMTVFFAKVSALLFFFIWVRWTVPRFRYDQLMRLGWIWFFEIALVNIFLAALILVYLK
jgi:NADH-quinone oxidoreductase subunit H